MPIASQKKARKTMNYYKFKGKMLDLCDKNAQNQPSTPELKYFHHKYDVTYKLIDSSKMALSMVRFSTFDARRRLIYREELAGIGIELTPRQVDYYINMICIILKEKYNIDT